MPSAFPPVLGSIAKRRPEMGYFKLGGARSAIACWGSGRCRRCPPYQHHVQRTRLVPWLSPREVPFRRHPSAAGVWGRGLTYAHLGVNGSPIWARCGPSLALVKRASVSELRFQWRVRGEAGSRTCLVRRSNAQLAGGSGARMFQLATSQHADGTWGAPRTHFCDFSRKFASRRRSDPNHAGSDRVVIGGRLPVRCSPWTPCHLTSGCPS